MGVTGPVRVVSPHLLVAQAVAAALRSVGSPATASSWESAVRDGGVGPGGEGSHDEPQDLVVVVDGLDHTDVVVDDVARLVRGGPTHVVVVTSGEAAIWWGGLVADARVDVATTTSVAQLAQVIEEIRAGGSAPDAAGRSALAESWARALDRRRHVTSLVASLSPQQQRVLELLASGRRVPEVGIEMGVTRSTVRSHVKALRAKLGVRSQLEAVAMLHEARGPGIGPGVGPGIGPGTGATVVPRPRAGPRERPRQASAPHAGPAPSIGCPT